LIYSSAVVHPGLVVAKEPVAKRPRETLDEILEPLGLAARDGAHGPLLIVAAPPEPPVSLTKRLVEDVVVTPGRHDIDLGALGPTQSLAHDQLALAPVAGSDPARIAALLPGVTAPEGSTTLNARGSSGGDVALVLDGLELY